MATVRQAKCNDTTVAQGREAETRALEYLENCGLRLVDRNFRVKGGEIDLIMRDGRTLVFIEVRQRSRRDFGGAAASITARKQRRIILAARLYLARMRRQADCPCRFDCLLIECDEIEWIRDAFTVNG